MVSACLFSFLRCCCRTLLLFPIHILSLNANYFLSFIVSFSFYPSNPETDGKRVQEFFLTTETAIRDHPLWAGATEEEIDCAMEVHALIFIQFHMLSCMEFFNEVVLVSDSGKKKLYEVQEALLFPILCHFLCRMGGSLFLFSEHSSIISVGIREIYND